MSFTPLVLNTSENKGMPVTNCPDDACSRDPRKAMIISAHCFWYTICQPHDYGGLAKAENGHHF